MGSLTGPEQERLTVDQLDQQLRRMRGMLYGYSNQFFVHMRVYTIVALALLAASLWEVRIPRKPISQSGVFDHSRRRPLGGRREGSCSAPDAHLLPVVSR